MISCKISEMCVYVPEDYHQLVAAQLRTAPADDRHPHQLPVALAGAQLDSGYAHLPGACARSNWEPCGRAVILDSA